MATLAVIVKGWLPSGIPSSKVVIRNGALLWPAGTTTLAGTVISEVSLDSREIARSAGTVPPS